MITISCLALLSAQSMALQGNVLYASDFADGSRSGLSFQGPSNQSFAFVRVPGSGAALRIEMSKGQNFSNVANGVPRAEVAVMGARLRGGSTYRIEWSMFIPKGFQFDSLQPEGIAQVHEGVNKGTNPFGLTLNGTNYQVDLRNGQAGNGAAISHFGVGSALSDVGVWTRWSLRYRPDSTGQSSVTELYKNGRLALSKDGVPNAYPGDDRGYFKFGIYKWWWQSRPSDASFLQLYFGDVRITEEG